ncbi:NHL repeat-containing protein [Paraliomyxa miuraensis]|uniref:hypothetical protein n=1 Tax=Paraliomyxa miuraensis TaxID=376150 RepID=UPI00224D72BB|nr:hypothetical protein [Paraliomyxa miuraensis]MCX4246537.1 hypothetical protein [Paraliomyxa miuraensis]
MRDLRCSLAGLLCLGVPVACADPCIDDGLGQVDESQCPSANSEGETDSGTTDGSVSDTMSTATMGTVTMGMTSSQSGTTTQGTDTMGTLDDTATMGQTETSGPSLWCVDADGDGFGDPDMCQMADEQPPGTVDNDDDCDDTNDATFPGAAPNDDPNACMQDEDDDDWGDDAPPPGVDPGTDCLDDDATTFPGAAPNDDPTACMQDEDDDDWGDDAPPPGVDVGTDCLDDDANVYPGAAELEMPPGQCMADADDDGWGDANPGGGGGGGGGPVGGADCYDTNPDLNPDTMDLMAFTPFQGGAMTPKTIETVGPMGMLGPFVTLETPMGGVPPVNIVTGSVNALGEIFVNDLNTVQLYTVDYAATCMMGTGELAPVGIPYAMAGSVVCGLEFGADGSLYGIDHADQLLTFDPATGQITGMIPIVTAGGATLNINSCGTAFDCSLGRLLVANGIDHSIYAIDTSTGEATLLRDLDPFFGAAWSPVGLEWNPLTRLAYLSTGPNLYEVDLDDVMAPPVNLGAYGESVSNLSYLPLCQ